jgi:hypothetical protein
MSPGHQSFVLFMLDDGQIKYIAPVAYVALVRGEVSMPEYAGQRMRVADLYVALHEGSASEIDNETYSYLYFDERGHADPHHGSFSLEENRAFYDVALQSQYSNIDCDPKVQKIREQIGDEFSWLPTEEERKKIYSLICKWRDLC